MEFRVQKRPAKNGTLMTRVTFLSESIWRWYTEDQVESTKMTRDIFEYALNRGEDIVIV